MEVEQILEDNAAQKEGSFLYLLHEKSSFDKDLFHQLYDSIRAAAENGVGISHTAQLIMQIYGQTLKCFLYHFDKNDAYKIENLPENYNKIIEYLEKSVEYYFATRI
jgi:hypothetical protein